MAFGSTLFARLSLASGCLLIWLLPSAVLADDGPFGSLDFTRLSKAQEQFFWKRLESLAFEEAAITYCGQADSFAQSAKQGIRACVTGEAMNKAESFFQAELKASLASLRERKAACGAKPEATSGWLGIDIRPVAQGGDQPGAGALVAGAVDGSPAAASDIEAGDIVASVNGADVADPKALSAKIRALPPGATVQLGILRNGVGRSVSVKLGAMAFDRQGRIALDMPALVASSKQDLKSVADEVTDMCRKCKTSIWAVFCR